MPKFSHSPVTPNKDPLNVACQINVVVGEMIPSSSGLSEWLVGGRGELKEQGQPQAPEFELPNLTDEFCRL